MKNISVKGARTHNLKDISVTIPRDQLVVITGVSGSGKSSLAFDTLYAEGQRRYVESLSAYARQFLSMMEKPDVDVIEGLSPAISIEQKSTSHNPRSTVGTITEIHDYLRLLFARVGEPFCPTHHLPLAAQSVSQMVDAVLAFPEGTKLMLLAPVVRERKGEHATMLAQLQAKGFVRVRVDGVVMELSDVPPLELRKKHTIEVVVDRLIVKPDIQSRVADSFETALRLSEGLATVMKLEGDEAPLVFSNRFACPDCGYSLSELEPRLFSFNNPVGACDKCDGLGVEQSFSPEKIIQDEGLSLAEGAVRGWGRHHPYFYDLLTSLALHYQFDLETPFNKLSKKIRDIILYGTGNEKIPTYYHTSKDKAVKTLQAFEGVIPSMQRRYRESESLAIQEELSKYLSNQPCEACSGSRLCLSARHVFIAKKNLPELSGLSIEALKDFFIKLQFFGQKEKIATKIQKEIQDRLHFLVDVGLDYLSLDRSAETLSGGEAQRIRLASQIGSGLVGVMYILDEPSIGLHQRDNERLLKTLFHLRDLGNSVIVVEHDEEAMLASDYLIDMGPGPGVHGGTVVAAGSPAEVMKTAGSLTGEYLSGKRCIPIPARRLSPTGKPRLRLHGARGNNLKNVTAEFPVGLFTCVTGVSGSGKSTLINDTLFPLAATELNRVTSLTPAAHDKIEGLEHFDSVVDIDQSPIGRTPRSNPATYTGLFTAIRDLFAGTQEARTRGYQTGRFSFNVKGGRCEACEGGGLVKVEMHFLADVYVMCDACKGHRYNRETLEILYKGKNIYDVLEMTVEEAHGFFQAVPVIAKRLQTLMDVGLSYIRLGQSATSLSGGEAQRIKLARELSKRDTGRTLYILDEPTTGLHFYDVQQLLIVLERLRSHGNTIIVIEHNLEVIKTADWIIDLGPEGGGKGGQIVVTGTPEKVAECKTSYTGKYLKAVLEKK